MKKLTVRLTVAPGVSLEVGELAEQSRRIWFEYDPSFLPLGIELSPFKLPLRAGLVEHTDRAFGPLPGLFDDSLPDGWGLLLMDRVLRRRGLDPAAVSVLDRLAWLGTRTMGALTYHPPEEASADGVPIDLHALGKNAEEVLAGTADEVLPLLIRAGGSPGGARPKVLVGVSDDLLLSGESELPEGYSHWLVKLSTRKDQTDAGPVEYGYACMAKAAGLDMPDVRLFVARKGRSVHRFFGVRRFDRPGGNRRLHVHTFGDLIHTNFRIPSADYADLFKVTRLLTRDHRDLLRAFRLMVFNIGAHNRDDHAKNFVYLLLPGGAEAAPWDWSLAPAYDLNPCAGPGGEHSTTVLGEGRNPTRAHCLGLARQSGIARSEAVGIIDQVNSALGRWTAFAEEAGCSARATAEVAGVVRPL